MSMPKHGRGVDSDVDMNVRGIDSNPVKVHLEESLKHNEAMGRVYASYIYRQSLSMSSRVIRAVSGSEAEGDLSNVSGPVEFKEKLGGHSIRI